MATGGDIYNPDIYNAYTTNKAPQAPPQAPPQATPPSRRTSTTDYASNLPEGWTEEAWRARYGGGAATPPEAPPSTPNVPAPPAGAAQTPPSLQAQLPSGQTVSPSGQTVSPTPGAPPAENTTNQGSQDVFRNALISQMSADPIPTVNDPAIAAQLNPFAAAQERARRDEVRAGAESAFAGGQSYGNPEKMAAAERAGQNVGLRAGDLVGQELTARRQQIQQALTQFGSMLSDDQRRALEKRAQDLDTQIRTKGLEQTGQLGNRELDIRNQLGMGGLNIEMIRALNQDKQFGQDLGFRIGDAQARYNNAALQQVMG